MSLRARVRYALAGSPAPRLVYRRRSPVDPTLLTILVVLAIIALIVIIVRR